MDGTFYTVQAIARQMARGHSPPCGSIVAVSSVSALAGGRPTGPLHAHQGRHAVYLTALVSMGRRRIYGLPVLDVIGLRDLVIRIRSFFSFRAINGHL